MEENTSVNQARHDGGKKKTKVCQESNDVWPACLCENIALSPCLA